MYLEWFNLKCKPFELVPNPDFLFPSKSHRKAVTYLTYGIQERVGFILLSGEVGSGKTTLVRRIIRNLGRQNTHAMIFNTKVTSEQLLSLVADDFGIEVNNKSKVELIRELNAFLIAQYADGYQPILIIDEAQNLSVEHLEEIRLLSNLETDQTKLLQVILVGQPELRNVLALPELRQLRQRINISCHVLPLTRNEMAEYILHRLEVAGNRDAIGFSPPVFDSIYKFSRGIPRLVNIMCDFLLVSACVDEVRELSPELVAEVVGDMDIEHSYWGSGASECDEKAGSPSIEESLYQRIRQLEERIVNVNSTGIDGKQILEKVSENNRSVRLAVERRLEDFSRVALDVKALASEVHSIKARLNPPRPKVGQMDPRQERSKPGIIKRIFGRC